MRSRFKFIAYCVGILSGGAFLSEKWRVRNQLQSANPGGSSMHSEIVTWPRLRELDYKTGRMSAALREVLDRSVEVPGFVIPMEDNAQKFDEFFLVPFLGACIHTPPPPPNQIVHVRMRNPISGSLWDAVWVKGRLHAESTNSPFGAVAFQLSGETVRVFRPA